MIYIDKKIKDERKDDAAKLTNDVNCTIDFLKLDFCQLTAVPGKVNSLNGVLSETDGYIDVDWYE